MTAAEIEHLLSQLKFERDIRNPPEAMRRGQFRTGWDHAFTRAEPYKPQTLESLTWRNLGYRCGRLLGQRTADEIDEWYDALAAHYRRHGRIRLQAEGADHPEPRAADALDALEVGRLYKRTDIHAALGGQTQGGISTPKGKPYLLLFTGGGATYGYQDGWDPNGIFLYSGEGQSGDMEFTGGNKAIRNHVQQGKDLHLFEKASGGRVRYLGVFACDSWSHRPAKDTKGRTRRAIVFHLVPVEAVAPTIAPARPAEASRPEPLPPLDELRQRALASATAAGEANLRDAKRRYYERSEAVRIYVLHRAAGICEVCGQPAPFRRLDGSPYLEPHHTRRLADSGPDHPRWVGAVCPTCHRHIHYGEGGHTLNQQLEAILGTREELSGV